MRDIIKEATQSQCVLATSLDPAPLGDLSPEGSAVIYVLRSEEGHRAQKMELQISDSAASDALSNSIEVMQRY